MGELHQLRSRIETIEATIGADTVGLEEVLSGDEKSLDDKIAFIKRSTANLKRILSRFKRCNTANDVFGDFSLEAAKSVVIEMFTANKASDRLRACEIVLNRALGKVADRSVSLNVEVSNLTDEELDHRIQTLWAELNLAGKKEEGLLIEEDNQESIMEK